MKTLFMVVLMCTVGRVCTEMHSPLHETTMAQCEKAIAFMSRQAAEKGPNADGVMMSGGRCEWEANDAFYFVPKN